MLYTDVSRDGMQGGLGQRSRRQRGGLRPALHRDDPVTGVGRYDDRVRVSATQLLDGLGLPDGEGPDHDMAHARPQEGLHRRGIADPPAGLYRRAMLPCALGDLGDQLELPRSACECTVEIHHVDPSSSGTGELLDELHRPRVVLGRPRSLALLQPNRRPAHQIDRGDDDHPQPPSKNARKNRRPARWLFSG